MASQPIDVFVTALAAVARQAAPTAVAHCRCESETAPTVLPAATVAAAAAGVCASWARSGSISDAAGSDAQLGINDRREARFTSHCSPLCSLLTYIVIKEFNLTDSGHTGRHRVGARGNKLYRGASGLQRANKSMASGRVNNSSAERYLRCRVGRLRESLPAIWWLPPVAALAANLPLAVAIFDACMKMVNGGSLLGRTSGYHEHCFAKCPFLHHRLTNGGQSSNRPIRFD